MSAVPSTSSWAPVTVTTTVLCVGGIIVISPCCSRSWKVLVLIIDLAQPESCRALTSKCCVGLFSFCDDDMLMWT